MRGDWCILRTSGAKTLALAQSLAVAGFDVWTPTMIIEKKRSRKAGEESRSAIAPTFVFARARHLGELAAIRLAQTSQHPPFSIFQYAGRIPIIREVEIAGFRAEEQKANLNHRKTRHTKATAGDRVHMGADTGAYAGLTGIVSKVGAQYSMVIFPDRQLKIATWIVSENVVKDGPSRLDGAAQAA